MRMKSNLLFAIFLLFLAGCGYESVYSSKGLKFSINNLNLIGDKDLSKHFEKSIKRFRGSNQNSFNINLNINKTKNIVSKDKKGDPSIYGLGISIKVDFLKGDKLYNSTLFTESINYNNKDDKFELKKYEKNLEKQLVDKIIEDFLLYAQRIQ